MPAGSPPPITKWLMVNLERLARSASTDLTVTKQCSVKLSGGLISLHSRRSSELIDMSVVQVVTKENIENECNRKYF